MWLVYPNTVEGVTPRLESLQTWVDAALQALEDFFKSPQDNVAE
ncbi:hypothetical protein [Photobacterium sp. 1_MG-2023]|nr:hypothetical protein [Photobacterium sp. 1_MG-2023]MDO6707363.1 hypothetical protein [Photobacterium sp. 1_MG-2023]